MTFQEWGGGWPPTPQKVIQVTGAIAGIVLIATYIANILGAGEPYWIATRGYMREHVQHELKEQKVTLAGAETRQIGIEIRIEDAERRRIRAKIADLELELKRNPNAPEGLRRAIEEQIQEQKIELQNKDSVVNDLKRLQRKAP
jgi:hypothetical protein